MQEVPNIFLGSHLHECLKTSSYNSVSPTKVMQIGCHYSAIKLFEYVLFLACWAFFFFQIYTQLTFCTLVYVTVMK